MRATGWLRAAIAQPAEPVTALTSSILQRRRRTQTLFPLGCVPTDPVREPVNECTRGRARIVHDQGETPGAFGNAGPCQRGRNVAAILRIFVRNHAFVLKSAA